MSTFFRQACTIILVLFLAAQCGTVSEYTMPSASMEPTLLKGQKLRFRFLTAVDARFVKHGDIVAFRYPDDSGVHYVKRVVAVGGDTVELRQRVLLVNGVEVSEPYTQFLPGAEAENFGPMVVPEGHVFLLGDNRNRSMDSRNYGTIELDAIKALVLQ